MDVVALAGGVGAARFLRGLVHVVATDRLTVVANTGDDIRLNGLHVSPNLDTVTYTLGGGEKAGLGWGRADEAFHVAAELRERYRQPTWFALGDRDIAPHLVRTRLLGEGRPLSEATAQIAASWALPFTLLPMTDDPVTTRIRTADGRDLHFQEWWVGEGAKPDVEAVVFDGADDSAPAPGVLGAIAGADAIVLCPSNPVVSIGPILAVPGVRAALRHVPVVGVSPIVGGTVVRGMADRLLAADGSAVTALAVAERYADFLDAWLVDRADGDLVEDIEALGIRCAATDTIMADAGVAAAVAQAALDLLVGLTSR